MAGVSSCLSTAGGRGQCKGPGATPADDQGSLSTPDSRHRRAHGVRVIADLPKYLTVMAVVVG